MILLHFFLTKFKARSSFKAPHFNTSSMTLNSTTCSFINSIDKWASKYWFLRSVDPSSSGTNQKSAAGEDPHALRSWSGELSPLCFPSSHAASHAPVLSTTHLSRAVSLCEMLSAAVLRSWASGIMPDILVAGNWTQRQYSRSMLAISSSSE